MRTYFSKKMLINYKMKISHKDWLEYRSYKVSKGLTVETLDDYIRWNFIPYDSYDHPRHDNDYSGDLTSEPQVLHCLIKNYLKFRQGQGAVWLCLSPDHLQRKLKMNQIPLLKDWCHSWFDETRYSFCTWCIESGESRNDPHPHVHALVQMNKGFSKNHSRDLRNFWNKKFPNNKLIGKDYFSRNVLGIYLQDKIDYMYKGTEGSDHGNFVHLDIHGGLGELS